MNYLDPLSSEMSSSHRDNGMDLFPTFFFVKIEQGGIFKSGLWCYFTFENFLTLENNFDYFLNEKIELKHCSFFIGSTGNETVQCDFASSFWNK
jgi:hypothetical protein